MEMTTKVFNRYAKTLFDNCLKTLIEKGKGYNTSVNDKRLEFFYQASEIMNVTPERALLGMAIKHFVSIKNMLNDIDNDKIPSEEFCNEKIGDFINYLCMLSALIEERRQLEIELDKHMETLRNNINGGI